MEDVKCPRCGSDKIDSLLNKYGKSKDLAMYGNCDCECRECSYKFKKL